MTSESSGDAEQDLRGLEVGVVRCCVVGISVGEGVDGAEAPLDLNLAMRVWVFQSWPMQSHELLRQVFQRCRPKQVAEELGLSISMIYKWAEPPDPAAGSGSSNPLDRIEALLNCTQDQRLVQWICQRAGGFFILNPKTNKPHPAYLIPATNEIVQEFADLLAVIAAASADNQITQAESKQIRARWEELKSVTEGFVACCEEGNFRLLKEKHQGLNPASVQTRVGGFSAAPN